MYQQFQMRDLGEKINLVRFYIIKSVLAHC